jgi:integrase
VVLFGAKAQAVLEPYLKSRGPDDYLFSPAEARAAWMRAAGRKVEPPADRAPGPYYTTAAYRAAIHNACARAGVPPWNPNQLRHLRNTELRKQFGLPVASSLSGHESLETTLIYAEEDLEAAAEAVRRIG